MQKYPVFGQWKSWLDLIDHLFQNGLFTEEFFSIPGTECQMSMMEIKAKAFEEVYAYLPTKKDIEFIKDKFEHIHPNSLLEMLEGLPTKSESVSR